jgi:hypothetical protein
MARYADRHQQATVEAQRIVDAAEPAHVVHLRRCGDATGGLTHPTQWLVGQDLQT